MYADSTQNTLFMFDLNNKCFNKRKNNPTLGIDPNLKRNL